MSESLQTALNSVRAGKDAALGRLLRFISIGSVSNAPGFDQQLLEAADFAREQLLDAGLENVELLNVGEHHTPLVLASDDSAGLDAPLVVIYGHFDVQEGGDNWSACPAFMPVVQDGRINGRGAGDNKGPVVAIMEALRAWKKGTGRLPVRVRVVLEGQEESGSGAVIEFVASERAAAFFEGASAVLVCDTLASPDGRPSITFGLRGLSYFHLDVYGPAVQMHSGHAGGAVQDPGGALAHLLASIWDPESAEFWVPGLMDKVTALSDRERGLLSRSPISAESLQHESGGVPGLITVEGSTPAEQTGALPAFTVHTLLTGKPNPGAAPTNIPISAHADFSIRLVPNQDPDEIGELVRAHLEAFVRDYLHDTVRIELTLLKGSSPVRFSPESPQIDAAAKAMAASWGVEPAFLLAGGSIPIVGHFEKRIPAPIILWGGTNADSNFHGPNENLTVENFHCSAEGLVYLLHNLSVDQGATV